MDTQDILEYRNRASRFCGRIGIRLTELSAGYARAEKTVEEEDLNSVGVVQGGVCFTLADFAAGSAMAAYGRQAVTLSAQYNFFRSALPGDHLTAIAREEKHGSTVCVFRVEITDQTGAAVGSSSFTFFAKEAPLTLS